MVGLFLKRARRSKGFGSGKPIFKRALQHGVGGGREDAADRAKRGQQGRESRIVGVKRDQDMARPRDQVERNIPCGAGSGQSGDKARPLIGFQQDDPAGQGGGQGQNGRHQGFLWGQCGKGESGCNSKSRSQELK